MTTLDARSERLRRPRCDLCAERAALLDECVARLPDLPEALRISAFAELQALPWEQRYVRVFGATHPQPRLTYYTGDVPYTYSGLTQDARPASGALADLLAYVNDVAGPANSCLYNLYRDGRDAMGAHSDNEAALGPDPVVTTVVFGAARPLRFAPRPPGPCTHTVGEFVLPHGGVLVMRGACQRLFTHHVPRTKRAVGQRISATFRFVRAPRPGRS